MPDEVLLYNIVREIVKTERDFHNYMIYFIEQMNNFAKQLEDPVAQEKLNKFLKPYQVLATASPFSPLFDELNNLLEDSDNSEQLYSAIRLVCKNMADMKDSEDAMQAMINASVQHKEFNNFWKNDIASKKKFEDPCKDPGPKNKNSNDPRKDHALDATDYFIMPIQRPPRYALLFTDLKKAIKNNDELDTLAKNAVVQAKNLAASLDDAVGEKVIADKKAEIAAKKEELRNYTQTNPIFATETMKKRRDQLNNILNLIDGYETKFPGNNALIINHLGIMKEDKDVIHDEKKSTNKHLFNAVNDLHKLYTALENLKPKVRAPEVAPAAMPAAMPHEPQDELTEEQKKLKFVAELSKLSTELVTHYFGLGVAAAPIIGRIREINHEAQTALEESPVRLKPASDALRQLQRLQSPVAGEGFVSIRKANEILEPSKSTISLDSGNEVLNYLGTALHLMGLMQEERIKVSSRVTGDEIDQAQSLYCSIEATIKALEKIKKDCPHNYMFRCCDELEDFIDRNKDLMPADMKNDLKNFAQAYQQEIEATFKNSFVPDELHAKLPNDDEYDKYDGMIANISKKIDICFENGDFQSAAILSDYLVKFAPIITRDENKEKKIEAMDEYWQKKAKEWHDEFEGKDSDLLYNLGVPKPDIAIPVFPDAPVGFAQPQAPAAPSRAAAAPAAPEEEQKYIDLSNIHTMIEALLPMLHEIAVAACAQLKVELPEHAKNPLTFFSHPAKIAAAPAADVDREPPSPHR